jgi:hypothetical protein
MGGMARLLLGENTLPLWKAILSVLFIAVPIGYFAAEYAQGIEYLKDYHIAPFAVGYLAASFANTIVIQLWSDGFTSLMHIFTGKK